MSRRRHINADPKGRSLRFLIGIADVARWPFERFAWLLERRLIWPLQERTAGRAPGGRVGGTAALVALAAVAVAIGALWPSGGNGSREQASTPARVSIPPAPRQQQPAEEPQGPALQGTPPTFEVGDGVEVAKSAGGEARSSSAATAAAPGSTAEAPAPESAATATSSSKPPVPAGPEAMKVARRFSQAFVFYEIGEKPARAKTVFGETATPELATALSERPPRLPQDAKVPKARVVNLVAGPRAGKAYTVSVSLLRVGLTSELRLEMKKSAGTWQVTDVRG